MTVRFTIKVSGKDKHIIYTDNIYSPNSRAVLIMVADKDGESFDAKKGASSGKADVTVEAAFAAADEHTVITSIKHPKEGDTFTIADADLPKKKP